MKKVHLGCGHEILPGFVNVDGAPLPGVDVVYDLGKFPWPFKDGECEEILMKHVLEHLPNTIQVMEEMWRICADGAKVTVRVPYWNARDFVTDPTHVRAFNEDTFNFFDPDHKSCRERFYYSKARFRVVKKYYFVKFGFYFAVRPKILCRLLEIPAQFLSNIIQVMEVELKAVKPS